MAIKELKKELSALSGVDFFNPKYRNVFKKYLPNDNSDSENVDSMEEERLNEVLNLDLDKEETPSDVEETREDDDKEEIKSDNTSEDCGEADDLEEESDEENSDKEDSEEDKSANEEQSDENSANEDKETEPEKSSSINVQDDTNSSNQELLETKVELQLVKSGVREDRLESAKKLFMSDIKSIADLDKLKDLIKQYPEWLKKEKTNAQPFGMSMDDNGDGLTEEEKRLKEMGINPREN